MIDTAISSSEPTDAELMRLHQDGQADAFSRLIRRYEKPLYGYLARYTGDRSLADDIFQDTFLQVHQSAGLFDTAKPFRPWLYTVATNKARDALRKKNRHVAMSLNSSNDDHAGLGALLPDKILSPDEISVNLETRQSVKKMIQELPDKLRDVLILSYYQELPQKEIAGILDIPVGTVKSRMHSAAKQFAEKWTLYCSQNAGN